MVVHIQCSKDKWTTKCVSGGVYDQYHINNQMWTHSYKRKIAGKQFLDFIKRRVDRRYDDNIIQIFSVLDNASIYINQTK
jgi:hypothetical protein